MASVSRANTFPETVDERSTALNANFRTPQLPPVEELQLIKAWDLVIQLLDLEAEILERTNPPVQIFDLVDQKRIDKEGVNLISSLRKELGLDNPDSESSKPIQNIRIRPPSKSDLRSQIALNIEELDAGHGEIIRAGLYYSVKDDHPDELFSRFLLQQDWDVGRCFARMLGTVRWRVKERYVDDIMRTGEEGALHRVNESTDETERKIAKGFLDQVRMGKAFAHGLDRKGRPVVTMRMRLHHATHQPLESIKRFTIWQIEATRLMLGPSIMDVVQLYDFTGARADQMELPLTKFLIDIFQRYFPGSLGLLILHNAPKIFEGPWQIIKGWLSPTTTNRVKFTHTLGDLEKYIPRDNILKELGGDDEWEYKYEPVQPGENSQMNNVLQKKAAMEDHRMIWIEFEEYTRTMVKMAQDGLDYSSIKAQRDECVDRLRASYWILDPFIRARTFYDRTGAIGFRRESALLAIKLTYGESVERLPKRRVGRSIAGSSDQNTSSGLPPSTSAKSERS